VRRSAASFLLLAGVVAAGVPLQVRAQAEPAEAAAGSEAAQAGALIDQSTLPTAIELKGTRPQADPSVLAPAATTLPGDLAPLQAPPNLALPDKPAQVRIRELRPLTLQQAERLMEVNNPSLKAVKSQVDQAKSQLRAAISSWYPTVNLSANGLPQYFAGERQDFGSNRFINPTTGLQEEDGQLTNSSQWTANFAAQVQWNLIDPARVPQIAAARDNFEKARDTYLITLRELRLQAATAYFELQRADEQVRIGQQSVRASLVSLKDARARFQAGVATKLEVLEAETQLARDQQVLTNGLGRQSQARRALAALLDLPQDISPTAAMPAAVIGIWQPSLQESVVAAYSFREELDRIILDISISNSNANAALAAVQPILSIYNTFQTGRYSGETNAIPPVETDYYGWNLDNAVGLSATWNIFDGGRARAEYRRNKQKAQENEFNFAAERDRIRNEVEDSYYDLRTANQDIYTTSREVLSSRESLRLARLRFQAGVTTQREVVDTQRDLTQAQVRYADAILLYNNSIAQLRRRTGLDQVEACQVNQLPAERPAEDDTYVVPIEPSPNRPACIASQAAAQG
jgi:outer membrane factor, OMF family